METTGRIAGLGEDATPCSCSQRSFRLSCQNGLGFRFIRVIRVIRVRLGV